MSFFVANNIVKQYSGHLALDEVSVHVPQGSVYGLLGPNGAGKTTLIRIINRITAPDSGQVLINGNALKEEDVGRIGYLPEERGLYKKMKVGEQSLYLARLKGLSKNDAKARLVEWFEQYEIMPWWNKKIEELSKGMAQKVQFIITLLHDPEILILDEPFSGFDPVNAALLKKEVLNQKAKGKTIILSTHDMASVEELCDNISLINKAKLVLEGKVNQIRQDYKSNNYELIFSGLGGDIQALLNGNYEILESSAMDEGNFRTLIKVGQAAKGNELLKLLIEKVDIHSYREILPSMNEVFIKAVSEPQKPEQA